jgi:hypothetical protein
MPYAESRGGFTPSSLRLMKNAQGLDFAHPPWARARHYTLKTCQRPETLEAKWGFDVVTYIRLLGRWQHEVLAVALDSDVPCLEGRG